MEGNPAHLEIGMRTVSLTLQIIVLMSIMKTRETLMETAEEMHVIIVLQSITLTRRTRTWMALAMSVMLIIYGLY